MTLAQEQTFTLVDLSAATVFFEQLRAAYEAKDSSGFEAARIMLMISLGLSSQPPPMPKR